MLTPFQRISYSEIRVSFHVYGLEIDAFESEYMLFQKFGKCVWLKPEAIHSFISKWDRIGFIRIRVHLFEFQSDTRNYWKVIQKLVRLRLKLHLNAKFNEPRIFCLTKRAAKRLSILAITKPNANAKAKT